MLSLDKLLFLHFEIQPESQPAMLTVMEVGQDRDINDQK